MFVTLLSLIVGEAVLGVAGLIVALPVVMTVKNELELMRARSVLKQN
jgi:predicted PurR-regulated permease PerM